MTNKEGEEQKLERHIKQYGVPKGVRTPVTAVKGQCPRPLDDGDISKNTRTFLVELSGFEPLTPNMPC